MKKNAVEVCDFCGAEVTDELLGVSPENDNVLICEECVEKAQKMLQDTKKNAKRVRVKGISYEGVAEPCSTMHIKLDLDILATPIFDNLDLVEKLGRKVSEIRL